MPIFTPKERKAHYSGVANGTVPTKPDSKYSADEQIIYAKGQRDARNDSAMGYLLGKNSPLPQAEKDRIKAENKIKREAYFSKPIAQTTKPSKTKK